MSVFFTPLLQPVLFEDISQWRVRFTEKIFVLFLFLYPLGAAATFTFYVKQGIWELLALDLVILLWILLALLVRRPPLAPSGFPLMVILFIMMTSFYIGLGPDGARPIWTALFVGLAAALYGLRGVWISSAVSLISFSLLLALIPPSFTPWRHFLEQPRTASVMTVINVNMLSLVIGVTIAYLLQGLEHQIQKVNASREQYQLLAENATDVIWTMNTAGRFVYVSPSIFQLIGYLSEELKEIPLHRIMTAESLAETRQILEEKKAILDKAEAEASAPISFDAELIHKNGKRVLTSSHVNLVRGREGLPLLFVGVTRDITQTQALEGQLRQAQKMEAVGRLAGGVAHDFNNVLCAIIGNADMILEDLPDGTDLRSSVEDIYNAAERAAALTRQLLAFSRKQVVEPRVVDLNDILRDLRPMLLRVLHEDVTLRLQTQEGQTKVRVDPSQIEQVIMNLVVNARDAMSEGGEVLIETFEVLVDEDFAESHLGAIPGAYALLKVSDTGHGMSAETQKNIFEPFFTTKEQGKGTGLGLATSYGIVQQSGGWIGVYSEPGRGATFNVYLPRVDETLEGVIRQERVSPVGGDETVLVAEDEKSVRLLAKKLLERLGYHVIVSSHGDEAITLAKAHRGPIDLLLTDVIMPKMNGRDLARKLTEDHPGLKVLFTSGYAANVISHLGMLDEEIHLLRKPYTLDSLGRKVREVLDAE